MRKYSCIQVSARSEYCCRWSAEMLVEAKVASGSSAEARASADPLPPPRNSATTSKCKIPLSISARRGIQLEIPTVDNSKVPLPENSPPYAVFIPGLAKLPCANPCRRTHGFRRGYNAFGYKHLAPQPESGFWHLTCSRDKQVLRDIRYLSFVSRCVASAHSQCSGFRGRNLETRNTPIFGVLEWSPRCSPKMEEVFYDHSHARCFASGRSAGISGSRAKFPPNHPRSVHPAGVVTDQPVR